MHKSSYKAEIKLNADDIKNIIRDHFDLNDQDSVIQFTAMLIGSEKSEILVTGATIITEISNLNDKVVYRGLPTTGRISGVKG